MHKLDPSRRMSHEILRDFGIQASINSGQKTRPSDNEQKKWTFRIMDFAVPVNSILRSKKTKRETSICKITKKAKEYEGYGDTNCN